MFNIPSNIKDLWHFVCLGILAFATIGGVMRLFQSSYPFEAIFSLLCYANLWYLEFKRIKEKK